MTTEQFGGAVTNAPTGTATTAHDADIDIDIDTIRQTYEALLWRWDALSIDDHDRLGELLRGHVQLLAPEVAHLASHMRGEQQRTAEYVLTRTRRMLAREAAVPPQETASHLADLATLCRALLTLYQHPGALHEMPVEDDVPGIRP